MSKPKAIGLICGGLVIAALCLSLWPSAAVASPPQGFYDTDTPVPAPTDTPAPPQPTNPPQKPADTPVPIVFDPLVTKLVNLQRAEIGDAVQFTIVITNPNSVDVPNVVIVDPLPEVVDYISTNPPQGTFAFAADTHTLTFNLGTLTPNQVLQIVIQTRVNSKGRAPDEFRNLVHLTWDDGHGVDSNPASVSIIPSGMPATGRGPGWRVLLTMAAIGLAGISLAGLGGAFILRRLRRER